MTLHQSTEFRHAIDGSSVCTPVTYWPGGPMVYLAIGAVLIAATLWALDRWPTRWFIIPAAIGGCFVIYGVEFWIYGC